jgi:hypothetical protein
MNLVVAIPAGVEVLLLVPARLDQEEEEVGCAVLLLVPAPLRPPLSMSLLLELLAPAAAREELLLLALSAREVVVASMRMRCSVPTRTSSHSCCSNSSTPRHSA